MAMRLGQVVEVDDKIDMKGRLGGVQYLQDDQHALSASDNILPPGRQLVGRKKGRIRPTSLSWEHRGLRRGNDRTCKN